VPAVEVPDGIAAGQEDDRAVLGGGGGLDVADPLRGDLPPLVPRVEDHTVEAVAFGDQPLPLVPADEKIRRGRGRRREGDRDGE